VFTARYELNRCIRFGWKVVFKVARYIKHFEGDVLKLQNMFCVLTAVYVLCVNCSVCSPC